LSEKISYYALHGFELDVLLQHVVIWTETNKTHLFI